MNLDEFITKYNGKVVRGGQCGELVRQYWIEVDKTSPPSYTNSKDYWFNPVPGYDKVGSPQKGDIAIYDGHGSFPEGHSAIYYDGRVFEQNADPDGSPAHLFNRANTYLLGYLRKQGGTMPEVMTKDAGYKVTTYLYNLGTGGPPTPEQGEYWAQRMTTILTAIDELGQAMGKELEARMKASYVPYAGDPLFTRKKGDT